MYSGRGTLYPEFKAHRVQQIAEVLGVHQEISVAEKRQVISSKLVELGYELESVQVIIQGRGDDALMFLVNENGIIKTIDYKVTNRRADGGTGPNVELRGVPRTAQNENQELLAQLKDSSREIDRLSIELKAVQDAVVKERMKLAEKEHELAVITGALEREKQKAKRYEGEM